MKIYIETGDESQGNPKHKIVTEHFEASTVSGGVRKSTTISYAKQIQLPTEEERLEMRNILIDHHANNPGIKKSLEEYDEWLISKLK